MKNKDFSIDAKVEQWSLNRALSSPFSPSFSSLSKSWNLKCILQNQLSGSSSDIII